MSPRIVVFGATGYTGRKVVAELLQLGLRPRIAGRNPDKLKTLAAQHGGLDTQTADVSNPASVRALLAPGDVLITTVGPFQRWGQTALDAALAVGAHYIDSTGEPAFVRHVVETAHLPARQRGLVLLSAFGYDYVPGHLASAAALELAGTAATRVDIGYFTAPGKPFRKSQGTDASFMGAALDPGLFWRGGRLTEDFGAMRWRSFAIGSLQVDAISMPSSEHLWLPDAYPHLTDINAYLGWFGWRSRWMSWSIRLSAPLLRIGAVSRAIKAVMPTPQSDGDGPTAAELLDSGSHIIGLAHDRHGQLLTRADLVGVDGYTYTAKMLAFGARAVAEGRITQAGALGPLGALGYPGLIQANRECGLDLTVSRCNGTR